MTAPAEQTGAHSGTAARPVEIPAQRSGRERDPLLDTLRGVALVRVILWHAFAATWLSWIFPAMPIMFFLAGSLLATSIQRSSWASTTVRRLRRVLVPLWVYAVAVWLTAEQASALQEGGSRLGQIVTWLVPLVDPISPAGQDGWLSSHLWYLRGYVWLVLLAPLVLLAARRPLVTTITSLTGLVWLELGSSVGLAGPTGWQRVTVGDLLCYGLFAVLGVAWARTLHQKEERSWRAAGMLLAGLLLGGTRLLGEAWQVPDLNTSYLLLTLSGLGWLLLVHALSGPLRQVARYQKVAAGSRWISSRAVTIYLWHPPAIVLGKTLVPGDDILSGAQYLGLVAGFTLLAVVTFGWVEDLAAGRAPKLWPGEGRIDLGRWRAVVAVMVAGTLVLGTSSLAASFTGGVAPALAKMPVPSDREALNGDVFDSTRTAPTGTLATLPEEELLEVLRAWQEEHPEYETISASIVTDEDSWSGDARSGTLPDGGDEVEMWSLTKSLTAALVVQEAEKGTIGLDEPMPPLAGIEVPDGAETITPRHLLRHTSGMRSYLETETYDGTQIYTPEELVNLTLAEGLLYEPGSSVQYSNSSFLWLGVLLEEVTGQPYEELVSERITEPLDLGATRIDTKERPGWVGHSSGGAYSTPEEIARWYHAYAGGEMVGEEMMREVLDLDRDGHTVGLGLWPLCPCGEEDGKRWAAGYGQVVGDSAAYHYPAEGATIYVRFLPGSIDGMDLAPELLERLLEKIRA